MICGLLCTETQFGSLLRPKQNKPVQLFAPSTFSPCLLRLRMIPKIAFIALAIAITNPGHFNAGPDVHLSLRINY